MKIHSVILGQLLPASMSQKQCAMHSMMRKDYCGIHVELMINSGMWKKVAIIARNTAIIV
jgi:hypothetical protein